MRRDFNSRLSCYTYSMSIIIDDQPYPYVDITMISLTGDWSELAFENMSLKISDVSARKGPSSPCLFGPLTYMRQSAFPPARVAFGPPA